jgi:hypothetical protein
MFTMGFSLIASAIGARRLKYNNTKMKALKARVVQEGWGESKLRKRDIVATLGPVMLAGALIPGVDALAGDALGQAVGEGAGEFTADHAGDLANAAVEDPGEVLGGVVDGMQAQVEGVVNALAGGAPNLVPIESMGMSPDALGGVAGQALATTLEMAAIKLAAEAVIHEVTYQSIDKITPLAAPEPAVREKSTPPTVSVKDNEDDWEDISGSEKDEDSSPLPTTDAIYQEKYPTEKSPAYTDREKSFQRKPLIRTDSGIGIEDEICFFFSSAGSTRLGSCDGGGNNTGFCIIPEQQAIHLRHSAAMDS